MKKIILPAIVSLLMLLTAISLFSKEVRCKINTEYKCDDCETQLGSSNVIGYDGIYIIFRCPTCGADHYVIPEIKEEYEV